ncbi:MAG: 16S rRNA (guanine(966)-N(2))-methyltransferase RsmD [Syntrophomonadaceae bacterium]
MNSLRVIAGSARGRRLKGPKGTNTRPITDFIKEALFNTLGPDIDNSAFLDLFSGSGSVGIEAKSRGASLVVFIDQDANAIKTIKENLAICRFEGGFEIYRKDVFAALPMLRRRGLKFDYIYADPPFTEETIFIRVIEKVEEARILKEEGIFIIRANRKTLLPVENGEFYKFRTKDYGLSTLHYYQIIGGEKN